MIVPSADIKAVYPVTVGGASASTAGVQVVAADAFETQCMTLIFDGNLYPRTQTESQDATIQNLGFGT